MFYLVSKKMILLSKYIYLNLTFFLILLPKKYFFFLISSIFSFDRFYNELKLYLILLEFSNTFFLKRYVKNNFTLPMTASTLI